MVNVAISGKPRLKRIILVMVGELDEFDFIQDLMLISFIRS
jgi:hypothetical protein